MSQDDVAEHPLTKKSPQDLFGQGCEMVKDSPALAMTALLGKMQTAGMAEQVQSMGYFWLEEALLLRRFEVVSAIVDFGVDPAGSGTNSYATFLDPNFFEFRKTKLKKIVREFDKLSPDFVAIWRPTRLALDCIHYAINHVDLATIKKVVSSIPDLNVASRGTSPLGAAAMAGKIPVMHMLAKHGAHIAQAQAYGEPLLVWMAKEADMKMIEVLMGMGADLNFCDEKGLSLPAHARNKGRAEIASFLEARVLSQSPAASLSQRALRL